MTGALRLATQWWFDQGGVRMFWDANAGNFASWRGGRAASPSRASSLRVWTIAGPWSTPGAPAWVVTTT